MKDIKVKKVSTNKTTERKNTVVSTTIVGTKRQFNSLPVILFGLMSTSILCYIFLVSSSIFYAVKTSQYEYKAGQIAGATVNSLNTEEYAVKVSSDRISYINKDNSVAISLK